MAKNFEELANEYIKPGSIETNENKIIQSMEIKYPGEKYKKITDLDFNKNIFGYADERSILLHKLFIYNLYIEAYNNCKKSEDNAVQNCMTINRIYEIETTKSSSNEHGPCSNIFDFFESVKCLEKNFEKKQKIEKLIGEVKDYLVKNKKISDDTSGGKPRKNKKRKTNKRKKTKTNKRKRTKSKTNKRKKRTRRR